MHITLRPTNELTNRFFIHYNKGKCTRQVIGKNKIREVPQTIASHLKLQNPKQYTGHCFRRTAATLLSESGANMQMIKQLGRWRSDAIAQGYIENSLHNRQMIFNGIIRTATTNTHSKPSTSTTPNEGDYDYHSNWSHSNQEFTTNQFHPIPCKHKKY